MLSVTKLSDLLSKVIIEHGSAVIQEKHIALLKEEAAFIERKLLSLESENRVLGEENKKLKLENTNLKEENIEFKKKLEAFEYPSRNEPPGDPCPYCRHPAGQLMDLKPHPVFGDMGAKTGFYKCQKCGKEYDREHGI